MKLRVSAQTLLSSSSALTKPRLATPSSSWTCLQCRQHAQPRAFRPFYGSQRSGYATSPRTSADGGQGKRKSRRGLKYAAAGGALGAGVLAFSDDAKHIYAAAERSGRVVTALAVCVNE